MYKQCIRGFFPFVHSIWRTDTPDTHMYKNHNLTKQFTLFCHCLHKYIGDTLVSTKNFRCSTLTTHIKNENLLINAVLQHLH